MLTEAETITGGASNGTVTYGHDALGRLASAALSGTTTTYGWEAVPNRSSVQVGGGSTATTAYDVANRPTSGTNPTATYANDDDGRLTGRPNQTIEWDHLGRLTAVKDGAGTTTLARYTYDPLDRLAVVEHPGVDRLRLRYTGATTTVVQWLDDIAGSVTRSLANGWTGERLADWTGSGSNLRIYGANAHHDTTWLASNTGTVSQSLRYDPWGTPRTSVPSGYAPFRFQGSWHDATVDLAWAVTRWYAPALGRFASEDSLLGEPIDPPSRHLYAYGAGEPIGRWDPDGRFWYRWASGDTVEGVGAKWLSALSASVGRSRSRAIINVNQNRLNSNVASPFSAGRCIWVPRDVWVSGSVTLPTARRCTPTSSYRTGDIKWLGDTRTRRAADRALGGWQNWYLLTRTKLKDRTVAQTKRQPDPTGRVSTYRNNEQWGNDYAILPPMFANRYAHRALFTPATVYLLWGKPSYAFWPSGAEAVTLGRYIFLRPGLDPDHMSYPTLSHEYIHVLQWQGRGFEFASTYYNMVRRGEDTLDPGNREEAIAYLWEGWIKHYYPRYQGRLPWTIFKPLPS